MSKSKDSYYFSHDSNAKDDPKCVLLIDQLGLEGYGIFWVLVETLRDQPNYEYPVNLIPALARRYGTTAEKMSAVVQSYELFTIKEDKVFFSESLIKRMLPLEEKRKKAKEAADIRWKNANGMQTHSECNTSAMLSKVKESKVKESKGKEKKNKDKESTNVDEKVSFCSEINALYLLYPNRCPVSEKARSLGKGTKDKEKLKKLLKEKTFDELKAVIEWYVEDCKKSRTYMKNFSTFLNNLPEIPKDDVIAKQVNLGPGEWIENGKRYYGSKDNPYPVPMDAPPRPDGRRSFNMEEGYWM